MEIPATAPEVLWEGDCECLVVKRLDFPVGPPAWAVMHSFGSSDFVLKDWHPEQGDVDWDTMTIKFPLFTAMLNAESLNALCRWWLKKNPSLLEEIITNAKEA